MDNDKYIGRLLDNRYEILGVIGTGGMAVVYKARCHRLNRLVAIKILKDDLSEDDEFRRRFHAESQAVAMLSHPNIMSVYDVSTSEEADYIVMELIDGITLKQYMEKKGVLNWKETLHFSMQIAKALEHAHSRGIVHRDIKPHNIMVLKNGSVKVTDFGIARIMSNSNTLTKEALGSVHYISPEQAKGGRVDNRSDLYSLGVVMYEMMTGRAPYDGESPVSVAIQHINGGAAMPSTLNPNIPGGMEQIIMRLMAGDPGKRYASATALLYDMEEFRKDPTILFDFNETPVEEVLKIHSVSPAAQEKAAQQPPRSTAERVAGVRPERPRQAQNPNGQRQRAAQSGQSAGQRQGQPRQTQPQPRQGQNPQRQLTPEQIQRRAARQQEKREQEEQRTRTVTIAVIGCSVVAVIAIVIFLWMLLNGGFGTAVETVPVPELVGKVYDELDRMEYPDFEITLADYDYSDQYEAGEIMDQTPEAEERVAPGTEIKVCVSRGPESAEEIGIMEDLADTTQEAAAAYLDSLDGDLKILPKQENSDTVEEGMVIRTEPEAGATLTRGQTVILYVSLGKEIVEEYMPVVEGSTYTEAVKKLNEKGFMNVLPAEQEESAQPLGKVINQSIEPGKKVDVTQEITLIVSKGLKMPNMQGKTYAEAEAELKELGFTQVSQNSEDSNEPKDTVLFQSVDAGSYCDASTKIILTVSNGIATIQVPNVVGKTYDEAKKTLNDAGFSNVTSKDVDNNAAKGQVVDQSVKSGESAKVTDPIVLSVSKGPSDVTKQVTIALPADLTEPYQLIVMLAGQEVYNKTIQPGTASVTVDMTGKGIMEYEVLIDNLPYKTDKVDFNS